MEARSRNLGFGFPGYDGCFPKATRSSRGRGDHTTRRSIKASELPKETCFFELLATVAGQLLQEQNEEALTARSLVDLEAPQANVESTFESSVAHDMVSYCINGSDTTFPKEGDTCKADHDLKSMAYKMEASYEHSAISCLDSLHPAVPQEQDSKPVMQPVRAYSSRKRRNMGTFPCQLPSSMASIERDVKTEIGERIFPKCTSKVEMDEPNDVLTLCSEDLEDTKLPNKQVGRIEKLIVNRQCQDIDLLMHAPYQVDVESPPLVSSGSSEETPFAMEPKSYSTIAFESSRQDGGREQFSCWKAGDDDGNSSESTLAKDLLMKSSSMSYIRAVKARRCANSTGKKRTSVTGFKRKRHEMEDGVKGQRDATNGGKFHLGRKKGSKLPSLKDDSEQSNFTPGGSLVDSELEEKVRVLPAKLEREKIPSPSVATASGPIEVEDSNVKLSIKSFMVPELMVDLPESATVANLKKAVMEAAMKLLGGGLCVRVLLQGKKVTNETESLLQAGISSNGKLDSLGFMLEPHPAPASTSVEDTFLVLSHGANQTPSRYPVLSKGSEVNAGSFHVSACEGLLEIDANSSGTEMQSTTVSPKKEDPLAHDSNRIVAPGSCALVLHASQTNLSNGLAVVPFGHSPGSIGINKRRIRRPFSVAEVEVLVQAVEKLGTGRWRDVKLHAFPQAKHRTYVDLKDKWKTLVHTASIAPHQRRGEPVPQVLLDRVIQAHSYWTAQQAKQ